MKYLLFVLLSSSVYAGSIDWQNMLVPLLMQKFKQKPQTQTVYYGGATPSTPMLDTKYYMGDGYLNQSCEDTQYKSFTKTLVPEKVVKLLSIYPRATLLVKRKDGERFPPSVILLLER
jgi:hypothetical protein